MDILTLNNVTVSGRQDATKTMVFVNGLGTDQRYWRNVAQAFSDEFRLVLFDNVGAVETSQAFFREKQSRYLNVNGYAADLLEICSQLRLVGDTVLVGHSLGAMAGVLASIERPRQFKRLILLGASPCYANVGDYHGGFSKEDIDAAYVALTRNYAEWSRELALAAMGAPDRPSLAHRFAESIARVPQDMMLTVLCSVLQTDHRASLSKVRVPTLIVQSQNDFFVPPSVAEFLLANISDSQLAVIDAHGHLPHVSAPEKVIEAIRQYVVR